jgi:hypothetical protein
MAFLGMLSVGFDIGEVVDKVDSACYQAEYYDSKNCIYQGGKVSEFTVEDHRREDEHVLDPLSGPHGFD